MAATIAEVSGGRFVLGLGAGWNETEYRAFGLPYDHRVSRFEESFEIVRQLLAGERVTLAGRFWQADDAVVLPRPPGAGSADDRLERRADAGGRRCRTSTAGTPGTPATATRSRGSPS